METIIAFSILYAIYLCFSKHITMSKAFKYTLLLSLLIQPIGILMTSVFFIKVQRGIYVNYKTI